MTVDLPGLVFPSFEIEVKTVGASERRGKPVKASLLVNKRPLADLRFSPESVASYQMKSGNPIMSMVKSPMGMMGIMMVFTMVILPKMQGMIEEEPQQQPQRAPVQGQTG